MRYSFVIPVYNRPDEVRELLESLTHQELFDFEIVIIEDGSSVSSEGIVESCRELEKPLASTLSSLTRMSSCPQAISLQ